MVTKGAGRGKRRPLLHGAGHGGQLWVALPNLLSSHSLRRISADPLPVRPSTPRVISST